MNEAETNAELIDPKLIRPMNFGTKHFL